jgi:hypothetical protein
MIWSLGARQLLDRALASPLPLLQEDQEIGHLLPVRPLVELPDDVGVDLAGRGQDPKEIPTRRWSERVSEASRILPKHRGASVSAPPSRLKEEYLHITGPPRARQMGASTIADVLARENVHRLGVYAEAGERLAGSLAVRVALSIYSARRSMGFTLRRARGSVHLRAARPCSRGSLCSPRDPDGPRRGVDNRLAVRTP